jgi:hypothetical protein
MMTKDEFLDKICRSAEGELVDDMDQFEVMEDWLKMLPYQDTRKEWKETAIKLWNDCHEFDEDNRVSLETFLLGGEFGSPSSISPLDGFHCLDSRRSESEVALKSFESFKHTVGILISEFAWDTCRGFCIDLPAKAESILSFELPNDEELKRLYEKAKGD